MSRANFAPFNSIDDSMKILRGLEKRIPASRADFAPFNSIDDSMKILRGLEKRIPASRANFALSDVGAAKKSIKWQDFNRFQIDSPIHFSSINRFSRRSWNIWTVWNRFLFT